MCPITFGAPGLGSEQESDYAGEGSPQKGTSKSAITVSRMRCSRHSRAQLTMTRSATSRHETPRVRRSARSSQRPTMPRPIPATLRSREAALFDALSAGNGERSASKGTRGLQSRLEDVIPDETIWSLPPQTAAKETLLRECLKACYPIVASHEKRGEPSFRPRGSWVG